MDRVLFLLGSTRMMDWTESAVTGLLFALEAFINPDQHSLDLQYSRKTMTPTVWVLHPQLLNYRIYQYMGELGNNEVDRVFSDFSFNRQYKKKVLRAVRDNASLYYSPNEDGNGKEDIDITGIPSLSVLDTFRRDNLERMNRMLESFEFNPFYYLALRYYVDSLPVRAGNTDGFLPPLATLHPYHSGRIQAQRGAFTVFPNYVLNGEGELMKKCGRDPRAMNLHPIARGCLYQIRIVYTERVARELLYAGERRTELYPDLEAYVKGLEAQEYNLY